MVDGSVAVDAAEEDAAVVVLAAMRSLVVVLRVSKQANVKEVMMIKRSQRRLEPPTAAEPLWIEGWRSMSLVLPLLVFIFRERERMFGVRERETEERETLGVFNVP